MRVLDGGEDRAVQTREARLLIRYLLLMELDLFPRSQHAGKVLFSYAGNEVVAVPTNHSLPKKKVRGDD